MSSSVFCQALPKYIPLVALMMFVLAPELTSANTPTDSFSSLLKSLTQEPNSVSRDIRKHFEAPLDRKACFRNLGQLVGALSRFKIEALNPRPGSRNVNRRPDIWIPGLSHEFIRTDEAIRALIRRYFDEASRNGGDFTDMEISLIRTWDRLSRYVVEATDHYLKYIYPEVQKSRFARLTNYRRLIPPTMRFADMVPVFSDEKFEDAFYEGENFDLLRGLKTGDVFVVRGSPNSSIGGAIARAPRGLRQDSDMSHAFLVVKATNGKSEFIEIPEDGKIEALIEKQVRIYSLAELNHKIESHKLARFQVLRSRDPDIMRRGAERMYRWLKSRWDDGQGVGYNAKFESFKDKNPSCLYCSQVVEFAYWLGSDEQIRLPAFPTKIDRHNHPAVRGFGMTPGNATAPADLLVDPRFDKVLYMYDPAMVYVTQLSDAVIDVVFDFINEKDHWPVPRVKAQLVGFVMDMSRRPWMRQAPGRWIWDLWSVIPKLKNFNPADLPADLGVENMRFIVGLQVTYEILLKELIKRSEKYVLDHDVIMSPQVARDTVIEIIHEFQQPGGRLEGRFEREMRILPVRESSVPHSN